MIKEELSHAAQITGVLTASGENIELNEGYGRYGERVSHIDLVELYGVIFVRVFMEQQPSLYRSERPPSKRYYNLQTEIRWFEINDTATYK